MADPIYLVRLLAATSVAAVIALCAATTDVAPSHPARPSLLLLPR